MSGSVSDSRSLLQTYDLLLVDLDGVVYLGDRPINAAPIALAAARAEGVAIVFVTNNASRPPDAVASALSTMGVPTAPAEVMTSAVGAAQELAARLPSGAPVLVVGGAGVREALTAVGLTPVDAATDDPVAVLQGFAPDVGWRSLAEASLALAAGAAWVATNTDLTLPSPRGPLPGNGSLVAALAAATGLQPQVIGKPGPALFEAAVRAHPGRRPLVIGDRLDTDIAGAHAAGLPSLCVLSGVSHARDLLEAPMEQRPDYIGRDLSALQISHHEAVVTTSGATCGTVRVTLVDGVARLAASAAAGRDDGLDGLRALCAMAWASAPSPARPPDWYESVLEGLDLD